MKVSIVAKMTTAHMILERALFLGSEVKPNVAKIARKTGIVSTKLRAMGEGKKVSASDRMSSFLTRFVSGGLGKRRRPKYAGKSNPSQPIIKEGKGGEVTLLFSIQLAKLAWEYRA